MRINNMDSTSFVPSLQKPNKIRQQRRLITAHLSHLGRAQNQAKRGAEGIWRTKLKKQLTSQMFILVKVTFALCSYLLLLIRLNNSGINVLLA